MNHYHLSILILLIASIQLHGQNTYNSTPAQVEKLRLTVESHPDDLKAHQAYIQSMHYDSADLIKQYNEWIRKNPRSAIFPYAIGNGLSNKESAAARPYLQKAIALDPRFAPAYDAYAGDAERWGQFDTSQYYLQKATELDPANADYALSYAYSFKTTDFKKYKEMMAEVARKFPKTNRGSQALYWLAVDTENPDEKIAIYEQQKNDFPADNFDWTISGMGDYYDLLLTREPNKATSLAQELAVLLKDPDDKKSWEEKIATAKNIVEINELLSKGEATQAMVILQKVKVPHYGLGKSFIQHLKSKLLDAAGNAKGAYENILLIYAKEPEEEIEPLLSQYGKKLGKDQAMIAQDVRLTMDTAAKIAPNFQLENYFTKSSTSLSDYKGKAVLLTYWFPGCGPCRGEFPYFEEVVRKYKGRDNFAYLGINIVSEQDPYVLPFLKSSGYSFTPLRDTKNWQKGPMENRGLAPVNFLIDGDGKIIFSWFRTEKNTEATLEKMIDYTLGKNTSTSNIRGSIQLKANPQWIYLRYNLTFSAVRDSARIENGQFSFKEHISEPVLASLWISEKKDGKITDYQETKVFLEPGEIGLAIHDSLKYMKVSGSKAQDELDRLNESLKPFVGKDAEVRKEFSDAFKSNDQKAIDKATEDFMKLKNEKNEQVNGPYLIKNPKSLIAIEILESSFIGSWYDIDIETLEKAERLFNQLPAETRAWATAKELARRMDAAKATSIGQLAKDFTLKDSLDRDISLSSFRGKYVLVDFWASWCVGCRENNPDLIRAYNAFKEKGFTILGVALDGGTELAWRKAMITDKLPWPNVNDIKYPDAGSVGRRYNVGSIPQNVLLDPSGKIIARNIEGNQVAEKLKVIFGSN